MLYMPATRRDNYRSLSAVREIPLNVIRHQSIMAGDQRIVVVVKYQQPSPILRFGQPPPSLFDHSVFRLPIARPFGGDGSSARSLSHHRHKALP